MGAQNKYIGARWHAGPLAAARMRGKKARAMLQR
jgi:hypothetical protein